MLTGMGVEHELRQCAVQAGNVALQHGEAGAGQLGTGVEIQAQRGADIDVVFHFEVELARHARTAYFYIVVLVLAHRTDSFGRLECSSAGHQLGHRLESTSAAFQLIAQVGHFGHDGETSSPLRLASPICLEVALRRDCSSCMRVCSALRSASIAVKAAVSRV
jgi:hypothetical protein